MATTLAVEVKETGNRVYSLPELANRFRLNERDRIGILERLAKG